MNLINPNPLVPRPFKVNRVVTENSDTFTLDIGPPEGQDLAPFAPGQFNMLYAFGVGDVPISVSGRSGQTGGWLHTTRVVGTVTRALHALKAGQMIGLRGPFGKSWPMELARGKDLVLLAGGIGLAPLRPVLQQVVAERDLYGRVALLYGARNPEGLLFFEDRKLWRDLYDIQVKITVDQGDLDWKGNVGVVTQLLDRVEFDAGKTIAMLCGPEIMMRFGVRDMAQSGVPEEQIFISMERNMKCAVGFCGHCQLGPSFVCKNGPVYAYPTIRPFLEVREL